MVSLGLPTETASVPHKDSSELLALTPTRFEVAVGEVLRDSGFCNVRHVGRAGDLSVDLWRRDESGLSVVVQCKRYSPGMRIGSPAIQEFIGMMSVHHHADRGIFITTTGFTQPAVELARQHGITLMDGPELSRLIEKRNRAVQKD